MPAREPKPSVTEDQIKCAKKVKILDYILANEPDNYTHHKGEYRLKDHDSLTISNDYWHWHSRGIGGKSASALNYLIKVRGLDFVSAVTCLANNIPPPSHTHQDNPPQERHFILPARNKNNDRVVAYLQSRGIDHSLILACIANGILYESVGTHNCVFTGKNEQGKTRFACMRGTSGQFRRDADGSDKRYGFLLPPTTPAGHSNLAVFEAPIDALSHQTMSGQGYISWDGWRLSLSGTSLLSLEYFLKTHKNISQCLICTDKDESGDRLAEKILALPKEGEQYRSMVFLRSTPPFGNDYNQALQLMNQARNRQNRRKYEQCL